MVGVASVVRARPDGYTLLLSSASMSSAVNPHKSLPYDELRDLELVAMLSVQHIPYRGPVEALADLMTGRIDFYFLPIAPALPLIKQGKVVALAVSTPRRVQLLPEVPTIAEAGYPNAEYLFWGAGYRRREKHRESSSRGSMVK